MPQPFNNAVMTNSGANLLTRAQAGEVKIEFTRIATGNGSYTAEEKTLAFLQGVTGLRSIKNSYPLSGIDIFSDYSVKITALITNCDPVTNETLVSQGYYINEMGLFAKPKDGDDSEEVLYSITVITGENGDFMPPYNGYSPAQITQEYFATVNNSADVTINFSGAVVTAEQIQAIQAQMSTMQAAIGIPTEPQTLVAGQSAVTFTLDNLKENSGIRVEVADISTLSHRGIVIEGNKVTVKFEPQEEDVLVRLVISEALSSTVN